MSGPTLHAPEPGAALLHRLHIQYGGWGGWPTLHGVGPARPEHVSERAEGRVLHGTALLRDGHLVRLRVRVS